MNYGIHASFGQVAALRFWMLTIGARVATALHTAANFVGIGEFVTLTMSVLELNILSTSVLLTVLVSPSMVALLVGTQHLAPLRSETSFLLVAVCTVLRISEHLLLTPTNSNHGIWTSWWDAGLKTRGSMMSGLQSIPAILFHVQCCYCRFVARSFPFLNKNGSLSSYFEPLTNPVFLVHRVTRTKLSLRIKQNACMLH